LLVYGHEQDDFHSAPLRPTCSLPFDFGWATVHHTFQVWGVNEAAHPVLVKSITADERERLIQEDVFAGRSVALELVAVVALWLFIGAFAVLFTI
jgi:hypothetical protein